ncbi:hypothetical protein VTN96DRAFT_6483 [Rasamsonia emersonii]
MTGNLNGQLTGPSTDRCSKQLGGTLDTLAHHSGRTDWIGRGGWCRKGRAPRRGTLDPDGGARRVCSEHGGLAAPQLARSARGGRLATASERAAKQPDPGDGILASGLDRCFVLQIGLNADGQSSRAILAWRNSGNRSLEDSRQIALPGQSDIQTAQPLWASSGSPANADNPTHDRERH